MKMREENKMKIMGRAAVVDEDTRRVETISFGDIVTIRRIIVEQHRQADSYYNRHRIAKGDTYEVSEDTITVTGDVPRLAKAIAVALPAYSDLVARMNFAHEPTGTFGRLYEAAKFVSAGVRTYDGKSRKGTPLEF